MYVARNKDGKLVISNYPLFLPKDIVNNFENDSDYYPEYVIMDLQCPADLYCLHINANCSIKFEDGCKEIKEIII